MFYESFLDFSWFEVWYISPLKTWKQQDLGFACIEGREISKWNQEEIGENSPLVKFFYRTYYLVKRHDMKPCTTFKNHFCKNTCNLGHLYTNKEVIWIFKKYIDIICKRLGSFYWIKLVRTGSYFHHLVCSWLLSYWNSQIVKIVEERIFVKD